MSTIKGINILGYINKQFGLGEGVRSNIRAVKAANIPYVINDFKGEISKDILDEKEDDLTLSDENPYNINLIQINVDNFDKVLNSNNPSYFKNKYNIGFWAWELDNFPTDFQSYIDMLDEIWVPSNFCLNAISKVSSKPVLRFMHSIEIPKINYSREDFSLPEDKVIFFTIFDYHSTVARKNPYATIDAFITAFGSNSKEALLIIKTSLGTEFQSARAKLKEYVKDKTSIQIIEEILPREKLNGLMQVSDVYVSLHRSEGFGLTMAEAMALKKPVIATAFSANTEFMTSEDSFLIPYTLIPTGNNYLYPGLGNTWADADVEAASKCMKILAADPSLRHEIGAKAKNAIQNKLSPEIIGTRIKERLEYLYQFVIPNLQNDAQQTILQLQHRNALLQAKVNALKNIKFVKLKLSFKNLKNKISGKNRKYIWED